MKNNNVYKFALTLAAAAVLAACSSGGSKGPSGPTEAEKAAIAAEKAAADKAAAEAAAKKAAEAKAKAEAAAQLAAERRSPQVRGFKIANKTKSDIGLTRDDQAAGKTSQADQATAMNVALEPSLDTIVVATPKLGKKTVLYVEDFDVVNQGDDGVADLKGVYLSSDNTLTKGIGAARTSKTNAFGNETKSTLKGEQDARVLVYDADLKDYTGVAGRVKKEGVIDESSVAEVYGRNTMLSEAEAKEKDEAKRNLAANLPLENKVLKNVQYGRVTVALDSANLANSKVEDTFKKGINVQGFDTYVVPYAEFNSRSKEDHYFTRGVNATTAASLSDLGLDKKDAGQLTYKGHAVTYGLDHAYHGKKEVVTGEAPNALIGVEAPKPDTLVSGAHVQATIDLANRDVKGSIYNTWNIEGKTQYDDLVKFNGRLAANGAITGNSELAYAKEADANRQGSFNASLFGNADKYSTELGGAVASRNGDEGQKWGAVFGAVNTNVKPTPVTPSKPAKPVNPISVATEGQKDSGSK